MSARAMLILCAVAFALSLLAWNDEDSRQHAALAGLILLVGASLKEN